MKLLHKDMTIPKGTLCGVAIYALMCHKSVFENPDSYIPSRLENPSEESTCLSCGSSKLHRTGSRLNSQALLLDYVWTMNSRLQTMGQVTLPSPCNRWGSLLKVKHIPSK